ncbi:MAG: energy transducer TonB [Thermodesulfobacteriota bacterium]|nr:energy transducer TonB [Thermodesulfobacteriota bacterium]
MNSPIFRKIGLLGRNPKSKIQNFVALGLALLINIFLFALLPNFVKSDFSKSDLETLVPVHLVQIMPQNPLPEKEEKLPEKKPPEKVIPTVRLQHKVPRKQEIKMEMPRLSFEIKGGMPVALPTTFRDFYNQGEVDRMPMAFFKMKPIYPYRARRLNITGTVEVKFLVDESGYVSNITILKSTPPGIFDDSVFNALPSWKFSPGEVRGHAVSTWVVTTIQFDMEET